MRIPWWFIVAVVVIASYPFNWYMMDQGVGIYNNDPSATSQDMNGRPLTGPNYVGRAWSLVASPVTAPISGIYWLAEMTGPKKSKTNPC